MDCRKVRSYLSLYLDSELSPETTFDISQHLEECEDCRVAAEREGKLEALLKARLLDEESGDAERWRSALESGGPKARRRNFSSHWLYPAIAAGLLLVAVTTLYAWRRGRHQELDLAAAVASAHEEFLGRPNHAYSISGTGDSVVSYFQRALSPGFRLNAGEWSECAHLGGNVCMVQGVRTAHLVCESDAEPVSVFWLSVSDLSSFPGAAARLKSEGTYIHCSVKPYEFCAQEAGGGLIVGVGRGSEEQLRALIESLIPPG
ncbi:MAG: zf-HC2 domain-containing protein [candidate division Zixibacteria bacterium]|nr:zf-HC2 domain-containing protein [candidate division Zixibacteria bacterium]